MNINVMTWNCDLYRESAIMPNWDRYKSIKNIIKERLELQNSLVVLQEIPYKSSETYCEHPFYLQLLKDFPEEKYKVKFCVSNKNQIMMTAIIYKNNDFSDCDELKNNNRIVYCKFQDVIFACVHMPTDLKIKRGDTEQIRKLKKWKECLWDELIALAKSKKLLNEKLIILGDFNAYIGCEQSLTESKFIELHRYANDIISDDVPTYTIGNGTPIDHIFVNFNTEHKYIYSIEDNILSDHKYIVIKLDL